MFKYLSIYDAIYYTHVGVCKALNGLFYYDDYVELICHGLSCGDDGGSCVFYHGASDKLNPNSKVVIYDHLFSDAYEITLEELYYYLSSACRNCIDNGQDREIIDTFVRGMEFFRKTCNIKGTAHKFLYRPNLRYIFYEHPLKTHSSCSETEGELCGNAADKTKMVRDINKLEWEAEVNGDLALAQREYQMQFGLSSGLDLPASVDFAAAAFPYGGRVAVLRECIKRNVKIEQLLQLDGTNSEIAVSVNQDVCCRGKAAEDDAERPDAENSVYRKDRFREQILRWQQKRCQPATGEDADCQPCGADK